jgi:uncharacterized protein (DUF2235 family)
MKKLVLFFDGTSNKFGHKNTNVVKCLRVTSTDNQIICYIPGVGSMENKKYYFFLKRKIKQLLGLAFGYGLQERVIEGYKFLSNNYEKGDEIFIFGFSRGAYSAKVLLGLIYRCGLMDKNNEYNMRYAYSLYSARKPAWEIIAKFKKTFSKYSPQIKYLGLWDSVSSVGTLMQMRNYPDTSNMKNVHSVRHAIAVDEKRCMFVNNTSNSSSKDNIQMWFSGAHSDVGGGIKEEENQLSKFSLKWIIDEAIKSGFEIDKEAYKRYVEGADPEYSAPSIDGKIHKTNALWNIINFLPRFKIISYNPKQYKIYIPLLGYRKIEKHHKVHDSLFKRMEKYKDYKPKNVLAWRKNLSQE